MPLQPKPESSITELSTTHLWHPWSNNNTKPLSSSAPLSSRAQEIARCKEEMMSLLKDVPESEYELSLTDLVEKKSTKEKELIDEQKNLMKEKKDFRKKRNSSRSFRSSSDGVLLNFFMPVSLTRSLTIPRGRRGTAHRDSIDCNNRESETATISKGCWPVFLYRRRDKSKREARE
ncbi:hypothetical protein LUZ60_014632 [Juncus effusus]|nr:hypothetical protein LUZ60_014632 [Juncus effusus]